MLQNGIQPDILICRMDRELPLEEKQKIALFCNLDEKAVIGCYDSDSIYKVPHMLHNQQIDDIICEKLQISTMAANFSIWDNIVNSLNNPHGSVEIAMVGKYVDLTESYKSLNEALIHAGIHTNTHVNINYVDAEEIESGDLSVIADADAILVPGGFGKRGVEGKIKAIEYARTNNIPFLGICLGMQLAVVEYARNVCGFADANSTEFHPESSFPVIAMIDEWMDKSGKIETRDENTDLGGTMRLGAQTALLTPGSHASRIYGATEINERHRHRYEVNNELISKLVAKGLVVSGISKGSGHLVETIELPELDWFFACQFHPEFTSNPRNGHRLFTAFVEAAIRQHKLSERKDG